MPQPPLDVEPPSVTIASYVAHAAVVPVEMCFVCVDRPSAWGWQWAHGRIVGGPRRTRRDCQGIPKTARGIARWSSQAPVRDPVTIPHKAHAIEHSAATRSTTRSRGGRGWQCGCVPAVWHRCQPATWGDALAPISLKKKPRRSGASKCVAMRPLASDLPSCTAESCARAPLDQAG
jgi:hypothetical protein